MATRKLEETDEDVLRRCLERIVPRVSGRGGGIGAIQRRRFAAATAYRCDIVTVRLATGSRFTAFLKDFGYSRLPKDGMEERRERELRVYRDLLPGANLGTPAYYGSVWDEPAGRFWLLLEFVEGAVLRDCEVESWIAAAGWLGRMHGYYAQHASRLDGCNFLVRHDASYFRSRADLALGAVSRTVPHLADRLAHVVNDYDRFVRIMASQPATLVHGSYRPQNILMNFESDPPRICPTDWELAALGSPLLDLAFISDGFAPPASDRFIDAYRKQAFEYGAPLPDREEIGCLVRCFRLHKIMKSLGESLAMRFPERVIAKLVGLGEDIHKSIDRG